MMSKVFIFLFALPFVFGSDVLEFKDSNFEQKVAEHSIILVEFYAPWCGHCKKLAPEYEEAATRLKKNDPPIPLAKVDCTAETKTCEKHGVSGYPTLKVFKSGQFAFEYGGDRSGDGIIKYMISKSGPSSKLISTEEELTKFLSSNDPVVVGFFKKEGSSISKTLQSVAEKLNEDFRFAHVFDELLIKKLSYDDDVVIFYPKSMASKFEDASKKYKGDDNEYKLRTWIEENIMGIAGHRTASNMKYFSQKPIVFAFYDVDYEKNAKRTNYWRNRILKVGKKFLDQNVVIHFAVGNTQQFSHELAEYGFESPDFAKVYIAARDDKNQKFKMDGEFSVEKFDEFVTDFLAGRLTPYLKSESIPASNDEPVKVVVAKSFNEIVNDPTKDVLIEFYAPWCGHCKSLAPKYDELAKQLANEKDIVIAKMDATANDVPSPYEVSGFPTLYFVPKASKESPKPYHGGRETDDFLKYIAAESTSPLIGWDRQGRSKKSDL